MFNPHARWDRALPQDEEYVGEAVEVVTVFKAGKFFPICFVSSGNKHKIKKINFAWKEKKGREVFNLFSVTDENNSVYKLYFCRNTLNWKLVV